jgi:hypothetical protein
MLKAGLPEALHRLQQAGLPGDSLRPFEMARPILNQAAEAEAGALKLLDDLRAFRTRDEG